MLATSVQKIYDVFFEKLEKDSTFFTYQDVSEEEAIEIANERAFAYLKDAVATIVLNCVPDIDFTNYNEIEFAEDLSPIEIGLLADGMYDAYFSREAARYKTLSFLFVPTDLQVFSPANERNSWTTLYETIHSKFLDSIARYASRDRITGKLKMIDYDQYADI